MKDWGTEFQLDYCEGTENPRLFNFTLKRKGGRLDYRETEATFKESVLVEIRDLINMTLKKHRRRME